VSLRAHKVLSVAYQGVSSNSALRGALTMAPLDRNAG